MFRYCGTPSTLSEDCAAIRTVRPRVGIARWQLTAWIRALKMHSKGSPKRIPCQSQTGEGRVGAVAQTVAASLVTVS
jgi:hypothetical protein